MMRLKLLCAALCFTAAAAGQGPVAAYAFDEGSGSTASDSSGGGNTGSIFNATWTPDGRYGQALVFNGSSSRVNVPDAASLRLTTGMTIEAWVRPVTLVGWRTVLMKEQTGGLVYGLYANSSTNRPSAHIFITAETDTRGTVQAPLNTWTHLAATFDGSVLRIYVNGVQASQKAVAGSLRTSTEPLRIGGNVPWGEYFNGAIDEVRIYNRALSAAEIQTDMNTPVGGTPGPDTTPPAVSIVAPAAGSTVSGTVALSASASDNVGVAGVQFYVNGTPLGAEDTAAPYSVNWDSTTVANGSVNSITARARDAAGNQTTSAAVSVTVNNSAPADTTAPTVSVTAPSSGATVSGTVALTASASDNVGVAGVQFYVNAAAVGAEDTTAPYSVNWDTTTVANGSGYTVTARARDAAGNQTNSTGVSVTVNNAAPPPSAGLVSAYGFNEGTGSTASDSSGNANNGVVTNASWSTAGKYGQALVFNGASSRVDIPDAASLRLTTGVTVEAWVRPTTLGGWRTILMKEQTGGLVYGLYANSNNNRPSAHIFINSETDTRGATQLPLNTWSHLAMTYDGSSLRIFVNGVQASSRSVTGSIRTSTQPLRIGGNIPWGEYFNGMIDEVRIYNRALTPAEIQTDMNTPIGAAPPADTTPPTVSVTAPSAGATVSGTVALSASASDNVGVAGVQFYVNATPVGTEDTTAPYSVTWDTSTVANGSYNITARARDAAGNQTTSAAVSVNVSNAPPPSDTTPPTVSVTAPAAGSTVSGTVTVSASASDNTGVVGVQFFVNGTALGTEDTTAPYSVNWDTTAAANGSTNSITARARDAAGNQTTSAPVSVTVNNTAPPPSAGLVSAWGFHEGAGTTTADVSGYGNHGTIANAAWSPSGKYGSGLVFNGASSRVDVPDSESLRLNAAVTLEAWVRPASLSGWRTIAMKEQAGGLVYGLYANSNTNRPSAHIYLATETDTRGTAQLPLNTWTHVAMTYDGTTLRIYVNGVQASSKALAGVLRSSTQPFRIGGNAPWGEYFNGVIDEVRVYNRALSAAEIQSDMNTPIGTTPQPADTVPPTVSVTAPTSGATVSGVVTLTATASDNAGVAGVQFYVDGAAAGPESYTAPYSSTWNAASAAPGPHTITAVARDWAGNRTTSTSVNVTSSATADPAISGSWSPAFEWPIVAINMVVTRTGEVMSWDGPPSNGGTSALLWTPSTGVFTPIPNNQTNLFCNAAVGLADGRIFAMGGHADYGVGIRNADIFDPISKLWSLATPMHYARWYPTATVLGDGRVFVISGSDTCESCIVSIPEIYDPASNTWTALTNAPFSVALYPLMFLLPDGRLLEAGATRAPVDTRVLNLTTQTWTVIDPNPREGHTAVMYELGKIMKSGSSADVKVTTGPSVATTFTLDMTQPSPRWQQTASMAYPRAFHNLTLLPDGTVLATGGGATREGVNYANAVLPAELWSPVTKTWTTMSALQYGRLYHSTAVLLLDGRVLVAGSGRVGPEPQFTGEIFSPPYLFKGARPTISSSPANAAYGSSFFVGTSDAASVTSVTLLRLSNATHSFNMEQRFLRLNYTTTAGGLSVTAPANGNIAPPGYYALYLLNSAGVPSTGAVIRIQ